MENLTTVHANNLAAVLHLQWPNHNRTLSTVQRTTVWGAYCEQRPSTENCIVRCPFADQVPRVADSER